MARSNISKAEAKFTATQKQHEKALNEREKARKEKAEKIARLKGLRLGNGDAKAEQEPAAVTAEAANDGERSTALPSAHRRQS